MRTTTIVASLFATGSILALVAVAPASAQTYSDSDFLGPLGNIVTAPVVAAGQIVDAPIAAANGAPIVKSNKTAAFIANAVPNVNFLNDSSRMALDRSSNPMIRREAHRIALEQTIAGNSMTAWADAHPPLMTGRSAYSSDPITGLASLPLNVIVGLGNTVTGGNIVASNEGRALLRSQSEDLSRLTASSGASFDMLYRDTQLDALRQLATLYSDYAATGDDPALRNLAQIELPKVQMRIRELNRI
jgi:predicted outer membrane protein